MDKMQQFAYDSLTSKIVKIVIGYEKGSRGKPRPAFITNTNDCERLIFNEDCKNNLAVYLKNHHIQKAEKIAVVAAIPTLRSILQLATEHQISEDSLVVIYTRSNTDFDVLSQFKEIEEIVNREELTIDAKSQKLIDDILKLPVEKRFEYWSEQLSKCIKCYACRAACPLCYCARCSVEVNQPQWIHMPSHTLGNLEWHVMRAMHMAGRCLDCGACDDACPVNIPLSLLTRFLIRDIKEKFGEYNFSLEKQNLLSTYKPNDKDTFIK